MVSRGNRITEAVPPTSLKCCVRIIGDKQPDYRLSKSNEPSYLSTVDLDLSTSHLACGCLAVSA